jgi:hypothetical protein
MAKGKPRWKKPGSENKAVAGIFCRSVGPGGTSVDFYRQPNGDIRCVWTHENCPYLKDGEESDSQGAAPDNHNVSILSAASVRRMLGE